MSVARVANPRHTLSSLIIIRRLPNRLRHPRRHDRLADIVNADDPRPAPDPDHRARLWQQMAAVMPVYDDFQAKAGRVIPVVALRPIRTRTRRAES